jgi:hypothetical protein
MDQGNEHPSHGVSLPRWLSETPIVNGGLSRHPLTSRCPWRTPLAVASQARGGVGSLGMRARKRTAASFAAIVLACAACSESGGGRRRSIGVSDRLRLTDAVGAARGRGPGSVEVGGEPIGIASGFGSIWVVNSEFLSGEQPSLSRIDTAEGTVRPRSRSGSSRSR